MKNLMTILCMIGCWAALGADNKVFRSFEATYDPSAPEQKNCDKLALGAFPDTYTEFNADGTVSVKVNVEENAHGKRVIVFYSKRKAFKDYFTNKPVAYNPPQLVKQSGLAKAVFPQINQHSTKFGFWNRTGYVRRLAGETDVPEVYLASDVLQLSRLIYEIPQSDADIINIKTSNLIVTDDTITLRVKRQFSLSNPKVPEWMKGASWTKSRTCVFNRI